MEQILNNPDTLKINGLSFFEFSRKLNGFHVFKNGKVVPKYILFWSKIPYEKILFRALGHNLIEREN